MANASITVYVTRDESRPRFVAVPYDDATVSENADVGSQFYSKIKAEDSDLQVCFHFICFPIILPLFQVSKNTN